MSIGAVAMTRDHTCLVMLTLSPVLVRVTLHYCSADTCAPRIHSFTVVFAQIQVVVLTKGHITCYNAVST